MTTYTELSPLGALRDLRHRREEANARHRSIRSRRGGLLPLFLLPLRDDLKEDIRADGMPDQDHRHRLSLRSRATIAELRDFRLDPLPHARNLLRQAQGQPERRSGGLVDLEAIEAGAVEDDIAVLAIVGGELGLDCPDEVGVVGDQPWVARDEEYQQTLPSFDSRAGYGMKSDLVYYRHDCLIGRGAGYIEIHRENMVRANGGGGLRHGSGIALTFLIILGSQRIEHTTKVFTAPITFKITVSLARYLVRMHMSVAEIHRAFGITRQKIGTMRIISTDSYI